MRKAGDIERSSLSLEEAFSANARLPLKPMIFTRAAKDWPASRWDLNHLLQEMGDVTVGYRRSILDRSFAEQTDEESDVLSGSFREYCRLMDEYLKGRGEPYFLSGDATQFESARGKNEKLSRLAQDFPMPDLCRQGTFESTGLWVSPRGVRSWLHYDESANLNAQLKGSKRAILMAPREVEHFPLNQVFQEPYGYGNFFKPDFWNLDNQKYPTAHLASYWEGDLQEGDVLYIPPFWIHGFEHQGEININVNIWWFPQNKFDNALMVHSRFVEVIIGQVSAWNNLDTRDKSLMFLADNPKITKALAEIEAAILGHKNPPKMQKLSWWQRLAIKFIRLKLHWQKSKS